MCGEALLLRLVKLSFCGYAADPSGGAAAKSLVVVRKSIAFPYIDGHSPKIAENNLAFEVVFVVFEFLFNVGQLGIKLILLRVLRGV